MALATRPKPTTHHKKRQGDHHRHSKHYLKTYWPYLPMLMIVVIGLAVNNLWAGYGHVLGATSDFSDNSLLADTNVQRVTNHESALTIDDRLAAAAQNKANDMATHDYWSHDSPDGKTPWSFISSAGYEYAVAGENLAYGFDNATDTVSGWMSSPEHRANILDGTYQNVGFGVANTPNYLGKGPATIVVAEYAAYAPAVANFTFKVPGHIHPEVASATAPTELSAQPVSRVALLTGGQASWSALVLSAFAGAAVAILLLRHGRYWRRMLVNSEAFISHHPFLDILMTAVATLGFLLTRSGGIIR